VLATIESALPRAGAETTLSLNIAVKAALPSEFCVIAKAFFGQFCR